MCLAKKCLLCFLVHSENRVANGVAIGGLMQRKGKESKIKEKKRKEIKVNNIIYIYMSLCWLL